jgi:hypothetical protein
LIIHLFQEFHDVLVTFLVILLAAALDKLDVIVERLVDGLASFCLGMINVARGFLLPGDHILLQFEDINKLSR